MVKHSKSKLKIFVAITLLVLLPTTFFFMPRSTIFEGPPTCLSRTLLKRSCPGCGMTRAIYSLPRGDFKRAHELNWRVWIVAPLLFVYWIGLVQKLYRGLKP